MAIFSRVVPNACRIIPVSVIRARVAVKQQGLKPFCAKTPVNAELANQKARNILPASVAHKPCLAKLSHICIDQRKASVAFRPSRESLHVLRPFLVSTTTRSAGKKDRRPILECCEAEIVSPQKLENEPIRGVVRTVFLLVALDFGVNPPRTDAAMREPSAEFRRVRLAHHPVPRLFVRRNQAALVRIVQHSSSTRSLAANEL
mmetsp:Transcript_14766/g.39564  ORF Transcript_14766/g.39564 Transcript_14766/m.39564 type:complete len:203 (-) Transcript_14766:940-1548(-)